MKKRVFIIHAWGYSPKSNWYSWMKKELEEKGFSVFVPAMPDTENPKIETWIPHLAKTVGKVDKNTFFIGHSVGCQTILRYLKILPKTARVGGAVFVAGWFKLKGLDEEEKAIATPWIETKIDFAKIKDKLPKSIALFSDNDPYVALDNQYIFKDKVGSKIIVEHEKEHFNEEAGIIKLPITFSSLLEIAS